MHAPHRFPAPPPPHLSPSAPSPLKPTAPQVWRAERSSFSFSRAFTLPDNAQADSICASMDNGVLKVRGGGGGG